MSAYPAPAELLPHAGPAVLLDEIVHDGPGHTQARAHITPAHPYGVPGRGVPVWVGIEMMAQTVAVHAGLCGRRAGRPPRQGMLLGTRHYVGHTPWFAPGAWLDVHAAAAFANEAGLGACDCRIECAGRVLATATIIIIEQGAT